MYSPTALFTWDRYIIVKIKLKYLLHDQSTCIEHMVWRIIFTILELHENRLQRLTISDDCPYLATRLIYFYHNQRFFLNINHCTLIYSVFVITDIFHTSSTILFHQGGFNKFFSKHLRLCYVVFLTFVGFVCLSLRTPFQPPKGAKVYPASRWRYNKRVGLKGQLAPHCVPWLKNSILAYKRLSTSLGSKTLNNTSSLGLGGGDQNLRPSCRRPPTRTFHTPVGTLGLDAPALVGVRCPNDGNKWDEVN